MANEVWVDIKGTFAGLATAMTGAVGEFKKLEKANGEATTAMDRAKVVGGVALAAIGVGLVDVAGHAVKMAGDFQTSQERLVTTAGESQQNLKLVSDGILKMAGDVGIGAQELSTGMYTVESAGYHGADAITVMGAAAQGAKMENADLATVTDAVTSAMQDYHMKASDAALVTSKMITAVSDGKTTFGDLTGAMSAVLPKASAAHLSFDEIVADLASMTLHGVSAEQAAQNMSDAIGHMQSPTLAMTKAMSDMGVQAHDVSANLSTRGLAGTLQMLSETILDRMGPAGAQLKSAFNQSTTAAQDAKRELDAMPKSLQDLAKSYAAGNVTVAQWRTDLKAMPADQAALISSWKTAQDRSQGFTQALKSGGDASKTYAAQLQAMTGDSASMNVALMLTGENSATVAKNIRDVAGATNEAGGHVKGWSDIQGNFNQQMDMAKASLGSFGIQVGTMLLPAVTAVAKGLASAAQWLQANTVPALVLAGIVGGILVIAITAWTIATAKAFALNTKSMAQDLAKAAVWVATKVATYATVAASAVASAAASAAAWIVANIAMIAATGGIILLIGVLVAAGIWLATHWSEVWDVISKAASAAWNWIKSTLVDPLVTAWRVVAGALTAFYQGVLKPVFDGIMAVVKVAWDSVLRPILEVFLIAAVLEVRAVIWVLKTIWEAVWGAITAAAKWAWDNVLKPVFDFIVKYGVAYVKAEMQLLQTIWEAVWGAIKAAAQWAWDNVLKPVFDFIVKYGVAYVTNGIKVLQSVWSTVWGAIQNAAQWAWGNVLKPIFDFIVNYGIHPVAAAINWLGDVWHSVWGGITGVVNWAWGIIQSVAGWISDKIGGILNMFGKVGGMIHDVAGSLGIHIGGFEDGGWVPGAPGEAQLAVVHGGEYVLSRDMLSGRVQPDVGTTMSSSVGGLAGGGTGSFSGSVSSGAGGNTFVIINNAGSVIQDRDLVEQIRQEMLKMGTRMPSTYQPYRR